MKTMEDPQGSGSSPLRKWGPLIAVVAVIAVVVGLLLSRGGGDDTSACIALQPLFVGQIGAELRRGNHGNGGFNRGYQGGRGDQ